MKSLISFAVSLFLLTHVFGQSPADEPCLGGLLTANPIGSECGATVTFTINNSVDPASFFSPSTNSTAGVTLPSLTSCGFTSAVRDFWYRITVPSTGYFSLDLLGVTNNKFFDWVVYASNGTTCTGSAFSLVPGSEQCDPATGTPYRNIGPLTPGSIAYLRMWLHADLDQGNRASFQLCVNTIPAPQPIPECALAVYPPRDSTIQSTEPTIQWTMPAFASESIVYLRDVTAGEPFQNIGVTSLNQISSGLLKFEHSFEWYVIPVNADGIANFACSTTVNRFFTGAPPSGSTCANALEICVPGNYPIGLDLPDANAGPLADFGCLTGAPNAKFFKIRATSAGDLRLRISSLGGSDIDAAVWGPFSNTTPLVPDCVGGSNTSGLPCGVNLGSPIACDFTPATSLDVDYDNVQANQVFLVAISNPFNESGNVSFIGTVGNSVTFACLPTIQSIAVNPVASSCNNDSYNANVTIRAVGLPSSGVLTVSDQTGSVASVSPPFNNPINLTLNGLRASLVNNRITAAFAVAPEQQVCTGFSALIPAPRTNSCLALAGANGEALGASLVGYFNSCTGIDAGEPSYCGATPCRSVFYKIRSGNVGGTLDVRVEGGNLGQAGCASGIRVSLLSDCTSLAAISPNCRVLNATTTSTQFSGLSTNTDYYVAVSAVNCSNNNCNWSLKFTGMGVVPVRFGTFQVSQRDERCNQLRWQTWYEQDVQYYEVMRQLPGESQFRSVARIPASNQLSGDTYLWNDCNLSKGAHLYRIRTIHLDGSSEISSVQRIVIADKPIVVQVFPVPANDWITIQGDQLEQGLVTVELIDGVGRILEQHVVQATRQGFVQRLYMRKYASGHFFVRVIDRNQRIVIQKFIKY